MSDPTPDLGPEVIVRRAPGAIVKDLQGTTVVAANEGGQGHCMDPIGQRIWDCLEQPRTLQELCNLLCAEYAVDAGTCLHDTTAFVRELLERGLLVTGRPVV